MFKLIYVDEMNEHKNPAVLIGILTNEKELNLYEITVASDHSFAINKRIDGEFKMYVNPIEKLDGSEDDIDNILRNSLIRLTEGNDLDDNILNDSMKWANFVDDISDMK